MIRGVGLVGLTMPSFWVGIILILLVALPTGLFPVGGFGETTAEHLHSIILPAITLAIAVAPIQIRALRASVIGCWDPITSRPPARSGYRPGGSMRRFVARNAAPPVIDDPRARHRLPALRSRGDRDNVRSPGIGQGLVLAARGRDIPSIQGYTLLFAIIVVAVYLLADILTAMVDPRRGDQS